MALQHQYLPRSSGAPCAVMRSVYMPLLTERDISEIRGYKHVAPTEQEPSICCSYGARTLDMLLLRSKNPRYVAPTEQEPSIPMMNTFRAKLNRLEIKLQRYRQLRWTTFS
jgi:hypothetical protein